MDQVDEIELGQEEKKPKISVVIPYFNKGNLSITMCLRSIQNQSFKDIEIIFVDDGSVEEKIIDILNIMKDDNRIILLRHKERKSFRRKRKRTKRKGRKIKKKRK